MMAKCISLSNYNLSSTNVLIIGAGIDLHWKTGLCLRWRRGWEGTGCAVLDLGARREWLHRALWLFSLRYSPQVTRCKLWECSARCDLLLLSSKLCLTAWVERENQPGLLFPCCWAAFFPSLCPWCLLTEMWSVTFLLARGSWAL